jgi:hypothetical protein
MSQTQKDRYKHYTGNLELKNKKDLKVVEGLLGKSERTGGKGKSGEGKRG